MVLMRAVGVVLSLVALAACGDGGGSGEPSAAPTATPEPAATEVSTPPPEPDPTPAVVGARVWASVDGHVFRSDDGGFGWRAVGDARVADFRFVDRHHGWGLRATDRSEILHTADGGESWASQAANVEPGVTIGSIETLAFLDVRHGAAVGHGPLRIGTLARTPLVIVTDDGGASWRPAVVDDRGNGDLGHVALGGLCFTDAGIGLACGKGVLTSSVCIRSADGGETWTAITPPIVVPGPTACAGMDELWITGGTVINSRDGGLTWQGRTNSLPPDRRSDVRGLAFVDRRNGWIVGAAPITRDDGTSTSIPFVLRTTTAGASWMEQPLPGVTDPASRAAEGDAQRVVVAPPAHVVVLGRALEQPGRLRGYVAVDGTTWQEIALPSLPGGATGTSLTGLAIVP